MVAQVPHLANKKSLWNPPAEGEDASGEKAVLIDISMSALSRIQDQCRVLSTELQSIHSISIGKPQARTIEAGRKDAAANLAAGVGVENPKAPSQNHRSGETILRTSWKRSSPRIR